jgi:hydrogenase/urease accessory protein HupE
MQSEDPGQAASARLAGPRIVRSAFFALLFSLLPFQQVTAHDPGLSSLAIRARANSLEATLTLAVRDAAQLTELDANHDGIVTQVEFARSQAELEAAVTRQLLIVADGKALKVQSIRSHLDEKNNVEVHLDFGRVSFSRLEIQSKLIASLPLGHRQYLRVVQDSGGVTVFEGLLRAAADRATAELAVANAGLTARETVRSFANFLCLGVKHIFTGYDHLLFLFGLLVVVQGVFSSLSIITSFTIAHSITLAAATFNLAQIPSRIVEPLIAASIVYVGIENLLCTGVPKARQVVTFGFGLIHGFGFASVLREMGISAGTGGVAVPLLSFNVGVELGQIVVAAVALPIIWKLRANRIFMVRWIPACSTVVALLGSFWFVERVWLN